MIDKVYVENEILALSWAIPNLNEFISFEKQKLTRCKLKTICFDFFLQFFRGQLFKEIIIWSFIYARLLLVKVHDDVTFYILFISKQEA
jgi:hypothetical protein